MPADFYRAGTQVLVSWRLWTMRPSFPDDQQDGGQLGEEGDGEAHGSCESHALECAG
jgi:hypothetical protein